MWRRFRRYLPFGLGTAGQADDYEEEEDFDREETSVDAPAGILSDEEEGDDSSPGFSSARSSFRLKESPDGRDRRRRDRTASASGQQSQHSPPRGKFLKRSETAPRSETRSESSKRPSSAVSARAERRKQSDQKHRPTSATPHSEGDAPNSAAENLTSRLSRRSSIISDLVALMVRRSSSMGRRGSGQQPGENLEEQPGERGLEEEEMDDEEDHSEDMGNLPREKILERIRHHKEIIGKVRLQPWLMRRKRRALKVARQYLQKQEAQVSKWGLYKVELLRRANKAWRWVKNLSIYLIPWESKIKQIESNFGSVVSSFFIFLRWVLGMNVANSLIIMAFVVVPEWLADTQNDPGRFNRTRHIKELPPKVAAHSDELNSVLDFGGYLQYSYLFYGYYSHETVLRGLLIAYNVPVAYVCVNLFLLVFCIFIILKKMTTNTRKSKLSSGKQEQYVFTWKVVNGWDYNIGEYETAASLAMANAIKLKEASTEYKKKFKQKLTFQKLIVRLIVNVVIFSLMGLSMVAIYKVGQITEKDTFIKQNAVSITVAAITLMFPPIFELILKLEQYRPRTALRIHLFRVLFFYLLNYFTLVYSLFVMLNTLEAEMRANEMWQREQQFLATQIRPYQYQFHIVHSPATGQWEGGANQSFYEVVSSQSSSDDPLQRLARSRNRQFHLFASASARSAERRRDRRQFVHKRVRLGPKRRKRPSPSGNGPPSKGRKEERDLNVLYSSRPFPGHEPASTSPEPETTTRPWTTVQPQFGPLFIGLNNPKAIVLSGLRGQQLQNELGTVWESRPIGPAGDWATTDSPNPLNYTSSPKVTAANPQPYRASNYDELCWETLIGQEIAKIVTTDLVMTVAAIMVIDFLRGLWIRYCSDWWCWDIEATFPEYGEFKVAENVLHLVNSQAMVCLGTILVPMLPLINCVKLVVVMYIRAWACMVCNVPAKQIFRASRSSNFYFWLLLAFVCMSTLPVGFVIAYKRPSKNCGPFAGQERFYSIIGQVLEQNLPKSMVEVISYFMSPGIIFPVFLLLVLIIYFLVLLVNGLRAANSDLNKQLTLERTEEKRKIFELAKGKRQSLGGISHKTRPSGESKKSSTSTGNGNGGGGTTSGDSYETAGSNGKAVHPLYFLNGGAKSGVRKSWHGGPTGGGTDSEKGEEPEGILLNPLFPPPKKLFRQHSDVGEGGPHSPSKSPLRHATFLPSLQSVDEKVDEEEADDVEEGVEPGHAEAQIGRRKRSSTDGQPWMAMESVPRRPSAQQSSSGGSSGPRRESDLAQPPAVPRPRFSWKDRLLICIGWTDPAKLEAKMRQQMDEADLERGPRAGEDGEEGQDEGVPLLEQMARRKDGHVLPAFLEEADYSVPSDEQEREEDEDEEEKTSSKGETVLVGPASPRIGSGMSQTSSSQQPVSVIYNRLAELAEEERPSSGASSSAGTGSQRSWVRQRPGSPSAVGQPSSPLKGPSHHPILRSKAPSPSSKGPSPFPTAQMPAPTLVRRTSSINGALEPKRAYIEREHVSESSPLSQRRHSPFPTEELARLSPNKKQHPMSPRAQPRGLPPAGPSTRGPLSPVGERQMPGMGRRASRDSAGSGRLRMDVSGSGSSSLGTRPPSDDLSLLLEEPSTPIGQFRPISAENVLGESFASSTGSDTRLQYANPYSSYAAAMCSPILPPDEEALDEQHFQMPQLLSPVSPIAVPLAFLRQRGPTPPTTTIGSPQLDPATRPWPSRESLARHSPAFQQPSSSSSQPMMTAPPLPRHGPGQGPSPLAMRRQSPSAAAALGHEYTTPTPTMRRRVAGGRPEPIYDQPLDQRRPSAPDEGGSTSGRGTMPPGGSSASAGSSPEFRRPKYKISSMSPASGRPRRDEQLLQGGQESGSSPEGSPRRRFEIRQRSGLGLGHPLRIPSQNGANGQGRNGQQPGREEAKPKTPPGEKQSTV